MNSDTSGSSHVSEVEAWRAARYERLKAPDGWLSLVARMPLVRGENTLELPSPLGAGTATWDGACVVVRAAGQERVVTPTEPVQIGAVRLDVLVREEQAFLRVRDANAPALLQFQGIPHYPVEATGRIVARFEPAVGHETILLDYDGGATESYRVAGYAVFELDGKEQRLTLLDDAPRPRLFVLFRDATSRDATYGAGRFLYTPPADEGHVVLDFNQAFNPPCALNPLVSCPLVPRANMLAVRIEAGEMRPPEFAHTPMV